MTIYILFATVAAGFSSANAVFGLQLVLFAMLSALLAATVVFYARRHTVAAGFTPVMPTFAGRVSEEQLRALTAYVKSLSEAQ